MEKEDTQEIDRESIFPSGVGDSMKSILSKTNDLTSASFNKMMDASMRFFGSDADPYSFFDDSIGNSSIFNTFKNLYGSESRPDGFVTYPVPSVELYSKCKNKEGLAAWDSRGYWHCIFPRAQVSEETLKDPNTMTKEDVEADFDHKKYGVFFENFNDLMDWRVKMREVVKQKTEKEWSQYREQEKAKWNFLNQGMKDEASTESTAIDSSADDGVYNFPTASTSGPTLSASGTSTSTVVNTLDNGDIEKSTVVRRYFDNGTSEEREYKEIIDGKTGRSKIVDQNVSKYPNHSALKKGGWFWNKKD
ncbi:hypothetical protein FOA43_004048 [Brettanomyces nanus]|uniref:Mitochondrial peculiar membrane protein 1 n=1 Tax=Eeniella nana TaxID=13502 RepID=A0A875S5R1_EENNA|nr:uncharacterized protein FOA43_004048 [Brettanomyces nanus]QPG76656.1 hypothetical protein FOA43_004048 [Brettanomyces nanus]